MTRNITKSLCPECKHFVDDKKFTCEAFPKGIPDTVVFGEFIHTKPFKEDNGIQFEQRK